MKDIEEILLKLVSIQSDTGTEQERMMAEVIYQMIKENSYFIDNPELCGTYEKNDVLHRPVVWALRRGKSNRTVILMGHYDVVEIETYGHLKPYALNPSWLRQELKEIDELDEKMKIDLENDDWAFGRGMADMKAGLAINMHTLFTNDNREVNILFVAVPDEENISSGAIQSIQLYHDLQKKYSLDYKLCIISEPQFRSVEENEDYQLISGSTGKILPVILAKGVLTHGADIFNGLNPGFIIAEIIRNMELSTDIVSVDRGVFSQPPTVQIMKDLKSTYDVSIPEFSMACLNILFLMSKAPIEIIEDLKDVCKKSLDFAIERYNQSFDDMKTKGFLNEGKRKTFKTEVLTLSELEDRVKLRKKDFTSYKSNMVTILREKIISNEMTLQSASVYYMKSLIEVLGINYPIVVIGIAPPYYPAVTNSSINKDSTYFLDGLSEYMKGKYNIGTKELAYFPSMCDMSYMSSSDPVKEREFLDNLILPTTIYDVPVERISELNIPSLLIGPAGKDIHQLGERVYMPDVKVRIPDIFHKIISKI